MQSCRTLILQNAAIKTQKNNIQYTLNVAIFVVHLFVLMTLVQLTDMEITDQSKKIDILG